MIKVMVVEDSLTSRKIIQDALERDPEIKVVGEASRGDEAVEKFLQLQPDVITIDILLPGMDGQEVTRSILEHKQVPILILTSAVDDTCMDMAYESLASGAFDIYEKHGDQRRKSMGLAYEGIMFFRQGKHDEGLNKVYEAFEQHELIKAHREMIYEALTYIYMKSIEHANALVKIILIPAEQQETLENYLAKNRIDSIPKEIYKCICSAATSFKIFVKFWNNYYKFMLK